MAFVNAIYNTFLRRTSTFALTVAAAVFFFEPVFDRVTDGIWESSNKGKLFKHIKPVEE